MCRLFLMEVKRKDSFWIYIAKTQVIWVFSYQYLVWTAENNRVCLVKFQNLKGWRRWLVNPSRKTTISPSKVHLILMVLCDHFEVIHQLPGDWQYCASSGRGTVLKPVRMAQQPGSWIIEWKNPLLKEFDLPAICFSRSWKKKYLSSWLTHFFMLSWRELISELLSIQVDSNYTLQLFKS